MPVAIGVDFGTSGARAIVIDGRGAILAQGRQAWDGSSAATDGDGDADGPGDPESSCWRAALFALLKSFPIAVRQATTAIAIDGTSATVLLCDRAGRPLAAPLAYNDGRGAAVADELRAIAPTDSPAAAVTSSLAKLLWWRRSRYGGRWPQGPDAPRLLHQADWLAFCLHGRVGYSDYHNALKLGCDPLALDYPDWLRSRDFAAALPAVTAPGTAIGPLQPEIAARLGFPARCQVRSGTTDSIAAFLASGAREPGEAVTSLGSTLALKLLSRQPVAEARSGVYSHRFGDLWLAGGASNAGGAVLRQFFSDGDLAALSARIDPQQPSPLDYYPLPAPGERFPVRDPHRQPVLDPRPDDPAAFLHGLLEGLARIEARGYGKLADLGAERLARVYTAGGGAANATWTAIRARWLGVPVAASAQTEAAYGTALLALRGKLR